MHFVIGLHMGVAGAALATILSQALSAVLVLWVLMRTKDMHRLELSKIRFDGRMFHRIIRIGLPAGLQSVMYTSSNILIQSSVNALGTDTVAAWTAYSKIDSLFLDDRQCLWHIDHYLCGTELWCGGKWIVYTRESVPVWELQPGQPYCCL